MPPLLVCPHKSSIKNVGGDAHIAPPGTVSERSENGHVHTVSPNEDKGVSVFLGP
mgnify:CR=1